MLRALGPPRRPATKLTQGIKVSCDRLHCRESPPLPKDEEGEAAAAAVAGAAGGPGGGVAAGGASAGGPLRHALLRGGQQALHLVLCLPPAPPASPPSLVSLDRVRTSTADRPPQHAFCLFSSCPAPALVARWSCEKLDRVPHVSLESSGSSLIVPKSTRSRSRASSLTARHRTLCTARPSRGGGPRRAGARPPAAATRCTAAPTRRGRRRTSSASAAPPSASPAARRPTGRCLTPPSPPLAHLHTPIRLLPPIRPNPPRAAPRCPKSHSTGVTAVHGGH